MKYLVVLTIASNHHVDALNKREAVELAKFELRRSLGIMNALEPLSIQCELIEKKD